ncbi:MAG: hypothetical protein V7711_05290 [Pseudomonadales bacterium]
MNTTMRFVRLISIVAGISLYSLLSACSSIPESDRDAARNIIDQTANDTIAELTAKNQGFKQELDQAAGYFSGQMSGATVAVLGGGYGLGVIHDNVDQTKTYMSIKRWDVGAGLGAGKFRVFVLINDQDDLESFKQGKWQSAIGADSVAGSSGSSTAYRGSSDKLQVYTLSDKGAMLSTTARLLNLSVNQDLTDTGVSDVSIPNKGFNKGQQNTKHAPRQWNRALPFLAQEVIDRGYDLPLPYGLGLTYAYVEQDMNLDNLWVGFNGSEKEPFPFVSFENASSKNDAVLIKADAWLFPFMNVYATLGKVKGDAPLDVSLDGNGMLDQLGTDCSVKPTPPLCRALQDNIITFPVDAKFEGTTYGVGAILAGGWKSYFVTLPINITYAAMDGQDTEGTVVTATPRIGKIFRLDEAGNIAAFIGGNYLKSDLTVSGSVTVPNTDFDIDYTIDQSNTDRWNIVVGANWDFNKHWSLSLEYNGFDGSREAVISSLVRRF